MSIAEGKAPERIRRLVKTYQALSENDRTGVTEAEVVHELLAPLFSRSDGLRRNALVDALRPFGAQVGLDDAKRPGLSSHAGAWERGIGARELTHVLP